MTTLDYVTLRECGVMSAINVLPHSWVNGLKSVNFISPHDYKGIAGHFLDYTFLSCWKSGETTETNVIFAHSD